MPGCDVPDSKFDPTDPGGTYRPDILPSPSKGMKFRPVNVQRREPVFKDIPDSPLDLFKRFVPESVVEEWVETTNSTVEDLLSKSEHAPQSRLTRWTPTTVAEVYTFIAIVISMENHCENAIGNYWRAPQDLDSNPIYPFTRHMSLRRFETLFRRLHVFKDGDVMPLAFGCSLSGPKMKAYRQVERWSRHIQETMSEMYIPGSNVAVDECMVGFTGKSDLKTHIPNKPTPDGIKIWVVAQDGIFMRWLWHVPNQGPVGIPKKNSNDTYRLTPTQLVVISLLDLLPRASYHVYLDNLFSSPDLFKQLYDVGIGASGTARINCGINSEIAVAKTSKETPKEWGWTMQVPTACEKVNQVAWRDNEIVLFLSSVYAADETITVVRRRPRNANSTHKRVARAVFGNAYEKELPVPVAINDYNHLMGAVDIGDQYRASYDWKHRWCRGPWQPLGWGFLLGTVLVNSFLLASRSGKWTKQKNSHLEWRKALISELFSAYSQEAKARKRARRGMFLDLVRADVPFENHRRGQRGVRAACKVCSTLQNAAKKRARKASSNEAPEGEGNIPSTHVPIKGLPPTALGCITCNVALCQSPLCWDMFHHSKIGVR